MSILRRTLLALVALALFHASFAAAQEDPKPLIEQSKASLSDVDKALRTDSLDDSVLKRLRSTNDEVAQDLRALVGRLLPLLDAEQKRLDQLKPSGGAVTDQARADLAAEQQRFDAIDASVRSARALLVQSDENASRIAGRRRALFARETFARSQSLLSPVLWSAAADDTPGAISVTWTLLKDWAARLSTAQIFELLAVAVTLIVLYGPVGHAARNVIARDPGAEAPTPLLRSLAAVAAALVLGILPLLALGALSVALDVLDISDPRLQGLFDALFDALRVVAVANALSRAVLAPGRPQWRLVDLPDPAASLITQLWVGAAAIVGVEKFLEPLADSVYSLSLAILLRAIAAAIVAALGAATLWRGRGAPRGERGGIAASARFAGWCLVALLILAVLFGYVALANFVVTQALLVAGIATTLFLADHLVQSAGDWAIEKIRGPARGARAQSGGALTQGVVVAQGLFRLTVVILAAILILAPWGIQSQDMFGALREVYQGVQIGGAFVSIESIVGALVAFAAAVILTRAVQNWLGSRFLPQTKLDVGLRHSIRTLAGYVGVVFALSVAGLQLGLDFQKVTIVAGALSVGIGFGLQAIVNNFVSGLILHAERLVRVGDWIVVGADQGFVRRISARATEIETVDRSTLILPNSVLVSGAVKNWMYGDRVARIVVAVNVAYETDIDAAQDLLYAAAKAHELVMSIPAPVVFFHEFADWALKFQLVCFVDDVMLAERVRSELNLDVLKRMKEAGFRIPYPK